MAGTKNRIRDGRAGRKKQAAIVIAALAGLSGSAQTTHTAQSGINFGAVVGVRQFCLIVVNQPGIMTQSADLLELSSKQPGGAPGTAQVTTSNGSFSIISADAPASFTTMPTDGDNGVTFATSYLTSGVTTTTEVPGTQETRLGNGVTDVSVHLTASRTGTTFPEGNYSAEVVLRCER